MGPLPGWPDRGLALSGSSAIAFQGPSCAGTWASSFASSAHPRRSPPQLQLGTLRPGRLMSLAHQQVPDQVRSPEAGSSRTPRGHLLSSHCRSGLHSQLCPSCLPRAWPASGELLKDKLPVLCSPSCPRNMRDTRDVTQWAGPALRPLPGPLTSSPPLPGRQEVPRAPWAWGQAGWESVTPWAGVSAGLGYRVGGTRVLG